MPDKSSKRSVSSIHETVLATASGGLSIALATLLSLLTLYRMPQGGTITPASMLPIIFCGLAFGPAWGIGIGAVYGLLQFIIAPFAAHWASIFLDYPLAFAMLGLAGLFAPRRTVRTGQGHVLRRIGLLKMTRIMAGIWLAVLGRLIMHLLSGVIFYRSYAVEAGQNPWIYSIIYNVTYMVPEAVIVTVLMLALSYLFRPSR